jgi:putative NADH-flavin reductase
VLIYTDGGPIGAALIDEARARGDAVKTAAAADAGEVADVARAIANQDTIMVALDNADASVIAAANKNILTAVRVVGTFAPYVIWIGDADTLKDESGVRHIARESAPSPRAAAHMAALNYLYAMPEEVRWTYLTPPPQVTDGPRLGHYRQSGDALIEDAGADSTISARDLAVAALDEAERSRHLRLQFTVAY